MQSTSKAIGLQMSPSDVTLFWWHLLLGLRTCRQHTRAVQEQLLPDTSLLSLSVSGKPSLSSLFLLVNPVLLRGPGSRPQ